MAVSSPKSCTTRQGTSNIRLSWCMALSWFCKLLLLCRSQVYECNSHQVGASFHFTPCLSVPICYAQITMQAAVAIRADMARLRLAHDAVDAMFTDMCAPGGPWDGAEYSLLVRGSVARGYGVDLPGHPCDLDVDVLFKDTRHDPAVACSPFSLANPAFVPNDFPAFTACVQAMAVAVDAFLGGLAAGHPAAAIHRQAGGVTRSLSLRVAVADHVDVEVDVFPKRHQTVGGLPGGAVEHRIKSFGGGHRFADDEVFQYPVAAMNW
jgi:hypothetical protein